MFYSECHYGLEVQKWELFYRSIKYKQKWSGNAGFDCGALSSYIHLSIKVYVLVIPDSYKSDIYLNLVLIEKA